MMHSLSNNKGSRRRHSTRKRVAVAEGGRGEPFTHFKSFFSAQIGRRLRNCFSNVSSLRVIITVMCVTMIIVAGGVALGVSLSYTLSAAEDYAIRFVAAISDKGKQKFEDFIDIPLRKAISYQYAVEQGRFPLPINKTISQRATDFNFWLDTFYTAFNETDNQLMFFSLGMQDESYFDCYSDVYPVIVCRVRDSVNLTNISTTPAGSFAKSFYVKRVDLRNGAVLSEQWSSTTYTPLARPWYWQVNHTYGAKSWTRVSLESTNLVPIIDINAACFSPVGFSAPSAGQTFAGVFSFSFRLAFLSVYLAELQRTKGAHILLVDNDDFLLATTISAQLLPIAYYVNFSAMSLQTVTQGDEAQNGPINAALQPFRQNAFGVSAKDGASLDGRAFAPRYQAAGGSAACTAVARLAAWYCRESVNTYGVTYFADLSRKIDIKRYFSPQKLRLRGSKLHINNISYLHSLGQYLGALAVAQPSMVNLTDCWSLASAAVLARGGSNGDADGSPLSRGGYPTSSQPNSNDYFYASVTAVRSLSGAENMYWRVLTLIPESDITEKIIEGRNYAIYVVTGVVVVCMVLALVGTWALLRPLREMATLMYAAATFQQHRPSGNDVAGGEHAGEGNNDMDAVIRNPSTLVELKQLQLAFITLSDQIARARQYLPATLLQGPMVTHSRHSSVYSRGSTRSRGDGSGVRYSESSQEDGFSEGDLDAFGDEHVGDMDQPLSEFEMPGRSRGPHRQDSRDKATGAMAPAPHRRARQDDVGGLEVTTSLASSAIDVSRSTLLVSPDSMEKSSAASSVRAYHASKMARHLSLEARGQGAGAAPPASGDANTVKSFRSSLHSKSSASQATPSTSSSSSSRSSSSSLSAILHWSPPSAPAQLRRRHNHYRGGPCSLLASGTCLPQALVDVRNTKALSASANTTLDALSTESLSHTHTSLPCVAHSDNISLPQQPAASGRGSPSATLAAGDHPKLCGPDHALSPTRRLNDANSCKNKLKKRNDHREKENLKRSHNKVAEGVAVSALRSDVGLVRRRVTVLYLNVSDFQHVALAAFGGGGGAAGGTAATINTGLFSWFPGVTGNGSGSEEDVFVKQFSRLVTAVSAAADAARGVLDSFHGDRFVVTFNAARPCASHAVSAVTAAKKLLERQGPRLRTRNTASSLASIHPQNPCRLRCGVATGIAVVGNLGSDNTRRFCTIGPVYGHAALLERLCLYHSKQSSDFTQSANKKLFPPPDHRAGVGLRGAVEVPLLMSEATLVDAETVHPVLYVDAIPRALPLATQGPHRAAYADAVAAAAADPSALSHSSRPLMVVGRCLPLVPLTLIATVILPGDDDNDYDHNEERVHADANHTAVTTTSRDVRKQKAAVAGGASAQQGYTDDEWMYQIEEASSAARPENALNDIVALRLREHNQYVQRYNRVWLEAMRLVAAHCHGASPSARKSLFESHTPAQIQLSEDEHSPHQQHDVLCRALAAADTIAAEAADSVHTCLYQLFAALHSLQPDTKTTGRSTAAVMMQHQQRPNNTIDDTQEPPVVFSLLHLPRARLYPLFYRIAADVWTPPSDDELNLSGFAVVLRNKEAPEHEQNDTNNTSTSLSSASALLRQVLAMTCVDELSPRLEEEVIPQCVSRGGDQRGDCCPATRNYFTLRGISLGSYFEDCILKPF